MLPPSGRAVMSKAIQPIGPVDSAGGESIGAEDAPQSWTIVKWTRRPREAPAWTVTSSEAAHGRCPVQAAALSQAAGAGRASGAGAKVAASSPAASNRTFQSGFPPGDARAESGGIDSHPSV